MIVCPNCKEEIDDDSRYCDQCGQSLLFCERCGRVGIGRRCTSCGGLMLSANVHAHAVATTAHRVEPAVPQITLSNDELHIRFTGSDGAIIGRRQGPYTQIFHQHMYVSGTHARLNYNPGSGWTITDMHSSNGTRLNGQPLQPDVVVPMRNGDTLVIANVSLHVIIR